MQLRSIQQTQHRSTIIYSGLYETLSDGKSAKYFTK